MDWNRSDGKWKQFKGRAKDKWGRLTDDDLDVINGRQDQLQGKIQGPASRAAAQNLAEFTGLRNGLVVGRCLKLVFVVRNAKRLDASRFRFGRFSRFRHLEAFRLPAGP